jgi:sporulation protein YlmC with PRC-barrel domain
MNIPIHADVVCTDGHVGRSTHIIVDLVSGRVTHFVVKTKEQKGEYLVSLESVKSTDRQGIDLNCTKEDVYALPPFHEGYFKGYDAYSGSPPIPAAGVEPSSTFYHPLRTAESTTESRTITDTAVRASVVELAVKKGADVLATDARVGVVDELVIDPETHRVTHLVLCQHHLLKDKEITIPVSAIRDAQTDTVFLKIDKDAVEALPTVALKKYPWE